MEITTTNQIHKVKEQLNTGVHKLSEKMRRQQEVLDGKAGNLKDHNVNDAYVGELILVNMAQDLFKSSNKLLQSIALQINKARLEGKKEELNGLLQVEKEYNTFFKDAKIFQDEHSLLAQKEILLAKKAVSTSDIEGIKIDKEISKLDKLLAPVFKKHNVQNDEELKGFFETQLQKVAPGVAPIYESFKNNLHGDALAEIVDVTDEKKIKEMADNLTNKVKEEFMSKDNTKILEKMGTKIEQGPTAQVSRG